MSAFDRQPTNHNFLSGIGFRFLIKKLPAVEFFTQTCTVPGVSLGVATTHSPFAELPKPGDRLQWDDFTLTFRVDENLANYYEVYQWLVQLGHPQTLGQTMELATEGTRRFAGIPAASTFVSDASLLVLSSHKNAIAEIVFRNLFPTHLSGLEFDTTTDDIQYLPATATFKYQRYDLKPAASYTK